MKSNEPTADKATDDVPSTIYLEPNLRDPQAAGLWEGYGNLIDRIAVIEEEHVPGCDHCEGCGDADGKAYRLPDERHGIPVCRDCLEAVPWVVDVDETPPTDDEPDIIVASDGGEILE